ncbi:type I-F CRISPR-associated protein Csy2 [Aliivibrio sp. S3MY1]|uniref:type I-F CRISPR-associated protein Csy2 n=1 Tax=unclassified Aliivibrio TaxID=2645654 RepID=UPI002378480D|nr:MULTISPECIES: type I-F CRISPR-associated protein Csy2 [unclassified Aliivibrio]MDD9195064.1 type I-F CRISPR-associated protein Csy2 [Aliivibrio sp. S3MY1]MDD9198354.1 type I-F CRISPR-associated protein Csy2 [Aliivibrio sp. S2MY1]
MSRYLLLKDISVQNANAIAGLTYGFPSMTNFLGFAHALSRKLSSELAITLGGVAVISHENMVHARQPKEWGDYVFALTRNPLTQKGTTAPINEEGRMNMTISLLIEVHGLLGGAMYQEDQLVNEVENLVPKLRIAGGQITQIGSISLTNKEEDKKVLRRLMPGFVLLDRSEYLTEHVKNIHEQGEQISVFDAWCDFYKVKYQATRVESEAEDQGELSNKAKWEFVKKPQMGYLVPIMSGFCAISPLYEAGKVDNVRDTTVPVAFTEAAYGVGEWMSPHRLTNIDDAIWRYEHCEPWYVAKTKPFIDPIIELFMDEFDENAAMKF